MDKQTEEKLAQSLTWETAEILPYIPYLLQDFWKLGSEPNTMASLIDKYIEISDRTKVLDLACGKGAVSIRTAKNLGVKVKGIDLIPEFIEYAQQKAKEYEVDNICEFSIEDINEAVKSEKDYDCVIFGAVGSDVLGGPVEALRKLRQTIKPGGIILIDEGYLADEDDVKQVRYNKDIYFPEKLWLDSFRETDLDLIETVSGENEDNPDSDEGLAAIRTRADELIKRHPAKEALFNGYVQNQRDEYADIEGNIVCVTWVLRKKYMEICI